MRIERIELANPKKYTTPVAACIGYFDGVHLGHQKLLERARELAGKYGCESAMITFDPDPKKILDPSRDYHHITPLHQRINLAVHFGIQNIYILKFTREMAELPPEEFLEQVLLRCNIQALVCGFDFHFGYKGKGNARLLQLKLPFEVSVVEAIVDHNRKISSSRISEAIRNGEIKEANRLLGYPFEITGYVRHGRQKGRTIGFPTANVSFSAEYLLPKTGVYAGYAILGNESIMAMINLGHNPTFNYSNTLSLEAHLLDFSQDLYGKRIRIQFIEYMRDEKNFKVVDNLRLQLEQDVFAVRSILSGNKHG